MPDGNPFFFGMPLVMRSPGARVIIHGGTTIISTLRGNVAGINHATVLAAIARGSLIEIGRGCGLSGATLVAREAIRLGDSVNLGANAAVYDNDFHPEDPRARAENAQKGIGTAAVTIGDRAWIAANAIVLKGVTIGRDSIVGAGAVVTRSIPDGVIAGGNPARVLRDVRHAEGRS